MSDKEELAEDRTEYAEDRTDWAEDRTILANERTFAGWMRTGMGAVAVALGLRAVFRAFEPTWIPKLVASAFILMAVLIFLAAWQNARRTQTRMQDHATAPQSTGRMGLIAALLSAGSIATGVILWFL